MTTAWTRTSAARCAGALALLAGLWTSGAPQASAAPLWIAPPVAAASQAARVTVGVLLAEIPSDVAVATDLVPTSNANTFVRRPSIAWSADGRRVAYTALRGDAWIPVVGNEEGEPYDWVSRPRMAGGHTFFHVGRRATESTEEAWLWIDGETLGPEDWMGELAVAPDGRQVAFWTQPGARVGNAAPPGNPTHHFAVVREVQSGRWSVARGDRYLEHAGAPPVFTADGRRVFTCAVKPTGWVVLRREGKREKELGDACARIESLAVSADGKALAVLRVERTGQPATLHVDGDRVGAAHGSIERPVLDAAGEHVAYVVRKDGRATVAIDDQETVRGRFDHVLELAFDRAGERLAFVANQGGTADPDIPGLVEGGRTFVLVGSVSKSEFWVEHTSFREVRDLVWDPSGERLAYCARDSAGWRIVARANRGRGDASDATDPADADAGEVRSPPCDEIGPPRFAPDGGSIGYGTREGRELWWRVLQLE